MQPGSSTTLPSSAFSGRPRGVEASSGDRSCPGFTDEELPQGPACEEAYYTRALVALFENRADAITVFQELRTAMPNSRYEGATTGWLNLLQDTAVSTSQNKALMVQLKHEVLHHLLDRGSDGVESR